MVYPGLVHYRPAVHGDWDAEIIVANENLYSLRTVDTKEKQNNVTGFPRGMERNAAELPRG